MSEKKNLPLSAKGGGVAYSLDVAVYLFINLMASVIVSASGISGTDGAKYIGYLVSPVAIGIVLCVMLFLFKQPANELFPVKTSPKYYFIGLLLIFGLLFSLNSLNDYLIRLFELMGYTRSENSIPNVEGINLLPAIIVIALLPALLEEALFRGVILNNIEDETGSINCIFIVGLLFCLYHGNVEQTIYQFICGCLFSLLAVRSRSVLPTVLIHFLNNAVILVLYSCGALNAAGNLIISQTANICITVASALCLVGAVVWLILDKKPLKKPQPGGVAKTFICASIGIAIMVALWIAGLF